jgi:hypothetical protein
MTKFVVLLFACFAVLSVGACAPKAPPPIVTKG